VLTVKRSVDISDLRRPALHKAPAAKLNGAPHPHNDPDSESDESKEEVQDVIRTFSEHYDLLVAGFAKPTSFFFGHTASVRPLMPNKMILGLTRIVPLGAHSALPILMAQPLRTVSQRTNSREVGKSGDREGGAACLARSM
jgi:hypothetical protein